MRNPMTTTDNMTEEEKIEVHKVLEHIRDDYETEIVKMAVRMFGVEGLGVWTKLATALTLGYLLKTYEIQQEAMKEQESADAD